MSESAMPDLKLMKGTESTASYYVLAITTKCALGVRLFPSYEPGRGIGMGFRIRGAALTDELFSQLPDSAKGLIEAPVTCASPGHVASVTWGNVKWSKKDDKRVSGEGAFGVPLQDADLFDVMQQFEDNQFESLADLFLQATASGDSSNTVTMTKAELQGLLMETWNAARKKWGLTATEAVNKVLGFTTGLTPGVEGPKADPSLSGMGEATDSPPGDNQEPPQNDPPTDEGGEDQNETGV